MPSIRLVISGVPAVQATYDHISKEAVEAGMKALEIIAADIVREAVRMVDVPYPPASMPGMPPHRRLGSLKQSIRIEDIDRQNHTVTVAAGGPGSMADYALFLEMGTAKMQPRPFMSVAADLVAMTEAEDILKAHIAASNTMAAKGP